MNVRVRKWIAQLCAAAMLLGSLASVQAQAGMIGTETAISNAQTASQESASQEERLKIQEFVQRDDVREQFLEMGVSPEEVDQRLASLTDAEVAELSERMDEAPAGGILGAIIIILLIWFLFFHWHPHHGHGH